MAMSQEEAWLLKEKYDGVKSDEFFADCKRLTLGEPLGYLIGWTQFLECKIWLDSRPLIPRFETEFWVEQAIATIANQESGSLGLTETGPRVLDLCAGSGCVGVAVAHEVPAARVEFSEIDIDHIPTIQKNLTGNNISPERTVVHHTSLFKGIPDKFDFILANPPYIDADLNRADQNVVDFEPYLALFGGKGGMEIIEQVITVAPEHLTQNGQLWLEHEPEQTAEITRLGTEAGFTASTHPDQYGTERFSILVLQ